MSVSEESQGASAGHARVRGTRAVARRGSAAALLALLLAAIAVAPASGRPAHTGPHQKRPNILVVMTDDMATSDLKFMPHVRRLLGDHGTSFTQAVDSFPLCCPARATFITGQYAHNHDVKGNFYPYGWYGMKHRGDILPRWLQKAGYKTALIGKWLNGYGALDAHGEVPKGFNIWRGLLDVSAYDYFNYVMNRNGKLRTWGDSAFAKALVRFANIEVTPNPGGLAGVLAKLRGEFGNPPYTYWGKHRAKDYSPDVTGQITQKLVRRQGHSKKPFFIWWAPAAPHREDVSVTLLGRPGPDPRPAPRYADKSKQYKLPEGPSFNEPDISDKSSNLIDAAPLMSQTQIDQLKSDYQGRAGSLLAVDDHVAKLVRTLKATHQYRNTVIVFVSDNGWLQGQHRITGDKFLPFEESLRVPFIVSGPGIPSGRKVRGQVSNVDFAPTLLKLAHAKAGRTQDGVSLLPSMRSGKAPKRLIEVEALARLFEGDIPQNRWDRPYTGVRTDRYTYIVWTETGEEELYDRFLDPKELTNLADEPGYAGLKNRLANKLQQLRNCKGASCDVRP